MILIKTINCLLKKLSFKKKILLLVFTNITTPKEKKALEDLT